MTEITLTLCKDGAFRISPDGPALSLRPLYSWGDNSQAPAHIGYELDIVSSVFFGAHGLDGSDEVRAREGTVDLSTFRKRFFPADAVANKAFATCFNRKVAMAHGYVCSGGTGAAGDEHFTLSDDGLDNLIVGATGAGVEQLHAPVADTPARASPPTD